MGQDEGTNGAIDQAVLDSEVDVDCKGLARAEIDTSAPFESVKEAASRFGGIGFWKPNPLKPSSASSTGDAYLPLEHESDTMDTIKLEEQAEKLEKDLIAKEKETLDVLKELEATKMVVEELKARLQKETYEVGAAFDQTNGDPIVNMDENKDQNVCGSQDGTGGGLDLCPSSTPGLILMDLKQAKVNLTRSTNDLANIRATVESYKEKIEKERVSLEKTRQRLSTNSVKILSLEKELNQTSEKLQVLKGGTTCGDPMDISREFQRLISEAEKFKEVGEAAKSEVLRAVSEIEEAKIKIKTAEMRIVAAKKMKEAAKATEAVALADIKALSKDDDDEMLTITREEYSSLMSRVHEAEQAYHKRVVNANRKVDEATMSKDEILKKVEEATEEVKTSRKAMEEALSKVDAANRCKLEVEAALRKWRSERGQRRHSLSNNSSTKFKNPYPSHLRKEPPSHLFGVDDVDIVHEDTKPILKPTLSIGEILSRKLLVHGDEKTAVRRMTLGQVVGKHNCAGHSAIDDNSAKQLSAKRKKFGFARISLLVAKQSKKKKKKKPSATS